MKILALMIASILAQNAALPTPTEPESIIEGIVIGANGPLAAAQVEAFWYPLPASYQPGTLPRATTSSDGKFLIRVSPGAYRITARAAGYVPQTYGATKTGADGSSLGTVLQLKPQESLNDLRITLTAEGILTGRVATTDGQALVRIEVAALKKRFTATGTSLEVQGVAQTDDRGEYRIAGLAAGSYILSASGLNPLRINYETFVALRSNAAAPIAPSPGAFGPVYYSAADQSSQASAVEVQSGIETRNIDFVLPKRRVYAIRGRVIGAPAEARSPVPGLSISPAYAEYSTGLISVGNAYQPDGTFELTGVAPGFHWVIANLAASLTAEQRTLLSTPGADLSQLPRPIRGAALVHVVDSDLENVQVVMVPSLEVTGQLTVDGEQLDFSGRLKDFKLELRPTDPLGNGPPSNFSALNAGGEFAYTRLLPTEYRLAVSALPEPFYVKEARYGGIDALASPVLLTIPSADRLYIVLGRGAEVSGRLMDSAAKPLGAHKIVLVPEGAFQRYDLFKTAVTNTGGEFVIHGVPLGNYTAFAWEKLEEFQYLDHAFISRFQDKGTSVRIAEKGNVEIQVNLIH